MSPTLLDSLQTSCKLSGSGDKTSLIIDFQTHVDDIKHKLGSLELAHIPDVEARGIDLFEWLIQAVDARDSYAKEAHASRFRIKDIQNTLAALPSI